MSPIINFVMQFVHFASLRNGLQVFFALSSDSSLCDSKFSTASLSCPILNTLFFFFTTSTQLLDTWRINCKQSSYDSANWLAEELPMGEL